MGWPDGKGGEIHFDSGLLADVLAEGRTVYQSGFGATNIAGGVMTISSAVDLPRVSGMIPAERTRAAEILSLPDHPFGVRVGQDRCWKSWTGQVIGAGQVIGTGIRSISIDQIPVEFVSN